MATRADKTNKKSKTKTKADKKRKRKRTARVIFKPGASRLAQSKEAPPQYETEGERRAAFLSMLSETGNVKRSCELVGVPRRSMYDAYDEDPEFAALWDKALKLGIEALEDECRRRAYEGVLEPVFQGGREVGEIRKFSDTLAIFLMKGAKPEKYRDNVNIKQSVRGVTANVAVNTNDPVAAQEAYKRLMNGEEEDGDDDE